MSRGVTISTMADGPVDETIVCLSELILILSANIVDLAVVASSWSVFSR
jgi:hypothetical protein